MTTADRGLTTEEDLSSVICRPSKQMSNLLDKAIVCGLLAAVIFTALALGTVEAWSAAIFELIVVALMLLWAAKVFVVKRMHVTIPPAALRPCRLALLGPC